VAGPRPDYLTPGGGLATTEIGNDDPGGARDARGAYAALLALGRGQGDSFTTGVKNARNSFSHYSELLSDAASEHERLRAALTAHAEEGTRSRIRDQVPPISGFRALFADEVAAELTFPGGEKEELAEFVAGISGQIAHFLLFVRAALGAYVATMSLELFDDWFKED
jgi:adenine-specific DNA methylase